MKIVYERKEKRMIRNYIVDYNNKGIAEHQVFQAPSMGLPAERTAEMLINHIRSFGWIPACVVEIRGDYTIDELKCLAEQPPKTGVEFFIWYEDRAEALKTLPQDLHRMKEFM